MELCSKYLFSFSTSNSKTRFNIFITLIPTGEIPQHIEWFHYEAHIDTTPGHVRFPYLIINNGGEFTANMDSNTPLLDVPELHVKNGGTLMCLTETCRFEGRDLVVEFGGLFSGEGGGYAAGQGDGTGSGNGHEGEILIYS